MGVIMGGSACSPRESQPIGSPTYRFTYGPFPIVSPTIDSPTGGFTDRWLHRPIDSPTGGFTDRSFRRLGVLHCLWIIRLSCTVVDLLGRVRGGAGVEASPRATGALILEAVCETIGR